MKDVLVGIREDQDQALRDLAKRRGASRAALIRDAIDKLIADERQPQSDEAFGLWGDKSGDGLAYQLAIRSEW